MIHSILIANRGEIACRIMRTCQELGIRTIAVYSDADAHSRHVQLADEAIHLGGPEAADSYLRIDKIIEAAKNTDADAIHPGFGFLAENAQFASACADADIIFIGPTPAAIEAMGNKRAAKAIVEPRGVPILPGYSGTDQSDEALIKAANEIGYPLMVKAAAGGGGKGMRLVMQADEVAAALTSARREGLNAFGSDELTLERALLSPRHIEVQVFGDQHGTIIHLGERDCSVQRRHQKVIEEAPAPGISPELRSKLGNAAVQAAKAVNYVSAGTVEFLYQDEEFYFLEMNTRIQVEHPVTEMVTGQDLVAWQIRIAEGEPLPLKQKEVALTGHAIEVRVYAEDPANDFLPVTGKIDLWRQPIEHAGVRVDSGLLPQDEISIYYDPMIAKIIAYGSDRKTAIRKLIRALAQTRLVGLTNNIPFLRDALQHPAFVSGSFSTKFIQNYLPNWQPQHSEAAKRRSLIAATIGRYLADKAHIPANRSYWRNLSNRPMVYPYVDLAEVHVLPQRNHLEVQHGEEQYRVSVEALDGNDLAIMINERRSTFTVMVVDEKWWVISDAGTFVFSADSLLPKPQSSSVSAGSLRAPMPGKILDIMVQVGEKVEKNQPLLKLEAMKMEHTIRSAGEGTVEEIYFSVGDQVGADVQLLQLSDPEREKISSPSAAIDSAQSKVQKQQAAEAPLPSKQEPISNTTGNGEFKSVAVFERLHGHLAANPDLSKINAVYQFDVTRVGEIESWAIDLTVTPGTVTDGGHESPNCVVCVSDDDLVAMTSGKLDPAAAFMQGRLKVSGDMTLALKLGKVLG